MNGLQETLLKLARVGTSQPWLPGRYVLAEWAAKRLTGNTGIVMGSLGSYSYEFDFQDLMQRQVWFGLYDQTEINLLKRLLKPGDTFFDVGANVGCYSFQASQFVGSSGHVYAFEPIPYNVGVIKRNLSRNHIQNITLVPAAVSQSNGTLTLYQADDSQANTGVASIIQTPRKSRAVTVPMISLDSYTQQQQIDRIDVMKMDIEGAEYEALQGMKALLSGKVKPKIICEFNRFLLDKRHLNAEEVFNYLQGFGYRFYNISSTGLTPVDADIEIHDVMNILCTTEPTS
jgi:FkbM family methyltransferase